MKGIINALTYLCPDFHRASLGSVSSYRMAHQRPFTSRSKELFLIGEMEHYEQSQCN